MINQNSVCNYLFNKEHDQVFSPEVLAQYGPPEQAKQFVNQSLQTLLDVQSIWMKNPQALFLFDPITHNNQCHLYALLMTQQIPNERVRHLMLLTSHIFLVNKQLLVNVCQETIKRESIASPANIKQFEKFLKDPQDARTQAARLALQEAVREILLSLWEVEKTPIYQELTRIAKLLPPAGYPKFAGVAYFVDVIAKRHVPIAFKVEVITKEGRGSFCLFPDSIPKKTDPVIVVELVATDSNYSPKDCFLLSRQCPTHTLRNPSKKNRHPEDQTCPICTEKKIDISSFQQRYKPLFSSPSRALYALGADFILKQQTEYLSFCTSGDYPILRTLFQQAQKDIEPLGLAVDLPNQMSIAHVQVDCAQYALSTDLMMKCLPEPQCIMRGLL